MMGSIILVGHETKAISALTEIIVQRFPHAQVRSIKPAKVMTTLLLEQVSLIVYVIERGKEAELKVIAEIRSVSDRTPLLIYGYLGRIHHDMVYLLDNGVHGLLSATSSYSEHIAAMDALLRGVTYVDQAVKYQALINLLHP